MKNPKPETPPFTRAGRRAAEAAMEAARFRSTLDGTRVVRQFEVHGIIVTEWVAVDKATAAVKE